MNKNLNLYSGIIYLSYLPLTQKLEEDCEFKFLIGEGIIAEYWDLSKIFFPHVVFSNAIERNYCKKVVSLSQLGELIASIGHSPASFLFISYMTREFRTLRLHRLLKKCACQVGFFDRAALPAPNRKTVRSFIEISRSPLRLLRSIRFRMGQRLIQVALRMGFIGEYDVVFVTGAVATARWADNPNVHRIPINSADFDKTLSDSVAHPELANPYVVFLDEYLPFHPDFKILNLKSIDAERYFKNLRNFFDGLEKKLGMEVVIAAHPKSNYADSNNFGNRKIFKNLTRELVYGSRLVLTHASTSLSYAVIYGKPLILLKSDEINDRLPNLSQLLFALSQKLKIPSMDFERPFEDPGFSLSKEAYSSYISDYLASDPSSGIATKFVIEKLFLKNFNSSYPS